MPSPLLSPLSLGAHSLANRFVLSPMTTNSSTAQGHITEEDLAYSRRRAQSAPLQITGAAYIHAQGQLFEFGPSLAEDACLPGLTKLAQAMQQDGAKALIQLTHAGRFAEPYLRRQGYVYGPSPMTLNSPIPHQVKALDQSQIKAIIGYYADATRRAIQAGFAGIELSSAQRLLPQSFLSTFSNQRTDAYGADSLENRARLILEIWEAIMEVVERLAPSGFILGYRCTPEETRGQEVGYTVEEFNQVTDWILERVPLDYLCLASWGRDVFRNRVRAAGPHQGRLINQVVHEHLAGRLPLMVTGGINCIAKAQEALEHAELVGISTPFVADPDFVNKFAAGDPNPINLQISPEDLADLAIPQAAFKDIVRMMDIGQALPQDTRDQFRKLEQNYKGDKTFKEV